MYEITFGELSAILMDFIDSGDGLLYLRVVGAEATVNAIWARLVSKEARGKKWGSEVRITIPGRNHPQYVAAVKSITYRTLRTRLPSGMVDLALINPMLTVAQDSESGFYLLTYETDGMPSGFFDRLNNCLSLPLNPEWANWLWEQGQQSQSRMTLVKKTEYQDGQPVEAQRLTETTDIPIGSLDGLGQVACYAVHTDGRYRDAWLQIIRDQLQLEIVLQRQAINEVAYRSNDGIWTTAQTGAYGQDEWQLVQGDEVVLEAPTLTFLLTQAREELGLYFRTQEAG